ncbi:MAG: hypothetical protein ABI389_14370 [Rhodanobacter sp.]
MGIVILGANGQIGRKLITLVADSCHLNRARIRKAGQAHPMRKPAVDEIGVAGLESDVRPVCAWGRDRPDNCQHGDRDTKPRAFAQTCRAPVWPPCCWPCAMKQAPVARHVHSSS